MHYIPRLVEKALRYHLVRKKSILLLGPRQTGKTTLIKQLKPDLNLNFMLPRVRLQYEKDPTLLEREVLNLNLACPLVILDEVQKIPDLLDTVQVLIDEQKAQFVLTGSSARKLRTGKNINLLPGRVVTLRVDPLVREEFPLADLETFLLDGSLPGVLTTSVLADRQTDLFTYVENYLESEIRAEAVVRNIGSFAQFLTLASLESGNTVSFRAISQEIGVAHTTIARFYEVLEDCLIVETIPAYSLSATRKRLSQNNKYLFFDLGVARLCSQQPRALTRDNAGRLFEQFVGLEILRSLRTHTPEAQVMYWRDLNGPEVDYVVQFQGQLFIFEVKWTENPTLQDAKHLITFLKEYEKAKEALVICLCAQRIQLANRVFAIPWQELQDVLHRIVQSTPAL